MDVSRGKRARSGARVRTETAPDLAIGVLNAKNLSEILDGGRKLIFGAKDARDGKHGLNGQVVEA